MVHYFKNSLFQDSWVSKTAKGYRGNLCVHKGDSQGRYGAPAVSEIVLMPVLGYDL